MAYENDAQSIKKFSQKTGKIRGQRQSNKLGRQARNASHSNPWRSPPPRISDPENLTSDLNAPIPVSSFTAT